MPSVFALADEEVDEYDTEVDERGVGDTTRAGEDTTSSSTVVVGDDDLACVAAWTPDRESPLVAIAPARAPALAGAVMAAGPTLVRDLADPTARADSATTVRETLALGDALRASDRDDVLATEYDTVTDGAGVLASSRPAEACTVGPVLRLTAVGVPARACTVPCGGATVAAVQRTAGAGEVALAVADATARVTLPGAGGGGPCVPSSALDDCVRGASLPPRLDPPPVTITVDVSTWVVAAVRSEDGRPAAACAEVTVIDAFVGTAAVGPAARGLAVAATVVSTLDDMDKARPCALSRADAAVVRTPDESDEATDLPTARAATTLTATLFGSGVPNQGCWTARPPRLIC